MSTPPPLSPPLTLSDDARLFDSGWVRMIAWTSAGVFVVGSLPAGWAARPGVAGSVYVRRVGPLVHVAITQVAVAVASTTDSIWTAPIGWRPSNGATPQSVILYSGATTFRAWPITPSLSRSSGAVTAVGEYLDKVQISYFTDDPLPTI